MESNLLRDGQYVYGYRSTEELSHAMQYAERIYELKPNDPGYLDTYAYVLYANGKYSQAAEFLQASIQQFELKKLSTPYDVYEHLGMSKEKLGAKTKEN